jgi:DNA-directed RNA polymerase specialized sigma subunit
MEVLHRYSHHHHMVPELAEVLERVRSGDQTEEPQLPDSPPARSVKVVDRLTEADEQQLVASYKANITQRELAERYKISVRTVRRIIRRRGASR